MHIYEYNSYCELYKKLIYKCLNANNLTLYNTTLVLTNPMNNHYINNALQTNLKHLCGKLFWHMSKSNNVHELISYSIYYSLASNDNLTLNSAYGYKLFKMKNEDNSTQFDFCFNQLKEKENTNLSLFFINDNTLMFNANKDYPSLLSGQFYIENNLLNLIVNYNYIDLYLQLNFDMTFFSVLLQLMMIKLLDIYPDLAIGNIIIKSSKVYIKNKDKELFEKALSENFKSHKLPYLYNNFIDKNLEELTHDPLIKFILENK